MSDEVGRVALGVELTGTKMESQLNNMISGVAKKAAGMLAAAFSVKKLVDFGKECIELGSDLSEVQNVVDVTFSTMAGKVDEFARSAAATYGLSETMAKKFTGTFGSMAEAFGFSEQAAYEMSTALTGLAGDVASFYNITQDEAYTKLKSVFSGETETLKDLGIVMTQSALDAYALANGYGKTTSAMTEMEKVSLRYAFVQDQLTNVTGDFYRTQDSWANQSRLLALQAESAMAAVGQGLINLLRPALVVINQVMSKIVELSEAFRDLTAQLFGDAGDSTSAVASDLSAAGSGADALASGLDSAAAAAKTLQRQVMGFDEINKLSDTSAGTSDTSGAGSGVGSDIPLLTALANQSTAAESGVSGLSERVQKLKAWLDAIDTQPLKDGLERLKTAAGRLGETLQGGLQWGLENVLAPLTEWTIEEAAPALVNLLGTAFDFLADCLEVVQPLWQWVWDNLLAPLAAAAGDAFVDSINGLNAVLEDLDGYLEKIKDYQEGNITFSELLEQLFDPGDAANLADDLLSIFGLENIGPEQALAELQQEWEDAGKEIATFLFGETFLNDVQRDLETAWESITDFFSGLGELPVKIKAFFTDTKNDLTQRWNDLTAGVADKVATLKGQIKQKWSDLKTSWNNIVSNIKDKAVAFKGQIKQKWSDLKTSWNNIVSNIKDKAVAFKGQIKQKWSDLKTSWNNIVSNIKDKTASMKAKIGTVWSSLSKAWANITTNIKDKTASMKAKIGSKWSDLKTAWSNLMANFKDKTVSIGLQIEATVNDVKNWFNTNVIDPINAQIHKIPFMANVSIPHLAQGGYVRANNPQLAVIGDNPRQGEIVAPEGKLQAMANQAAAGVGASILAALAKAQPAVNGAALVRRSTPYLTSAGASARAQGQNGSGQASLSQVETLLKEILTLLQTREIVEFDPESLRQYVIRKTNSHTRTTGQCELLV